MKRPILIGIIVIIIVGFLLYKPAQVFLQKIWADKGLTKKTGQELLPEEKITMPKTLEGKNIAMVITFREFRDIEYFIPKNILQGAGAKIVTVSSQKGTAVGADGGEVNVDQDFSGFQAEDFDAVVFIGGPGMAKRLDDESFHKIAQDTVKADRVLGAICVSPALLANAGVLSGKKATVWSAPLNKETIKILKENGAIYEDKTVVVDGKIVTGNGPGAAKEWAEAITEVLISQY